MKKREGTREGLAGSEGSLEGVRLPLGVEDGRDQRGRGGGERKS